MRLVTAVLTVAGTVSGLAAAVTGYHATSAVRPAAVHHVDTALPAVGRPLPAPPARIRVRIAPCERPAHLVHGACVTRHDRTVVVYDVPPPAPAPAVVPAAPAVAAPVAPSRPAVHTAPRPTPSADDSRDHEESDEHGEGHEQEHEHEGGDDGGHEDEDD